MTQKIDALVQSSLLKAATINEHFKHNPEDVAAALTTPLWDAADDMPKIHVKERKNVTKAHEKLSHKDYNDDDTGHIEHYTGAGSHSLNKTLVEDHAAGRPHSSVLHRGLQSIIAKAPKLKRDTHVYSGLGYHPKDVKFNVGSVVHLPAYTSSSLNIRTAAHFAEVHIEHEEGKGGFHILHFHLPKGYNKGTYIGDHSKHKTEKEFLLDHNQKWKIHSHQEVGSQHIWTLKPHDEKLNEALVHRPMSLRSLTRSKSVKRLSTDGWHNSPISSHQYTTPSHIVDQHEDAITDGTKHSSKLSDLQFSGRQLSTLEKTHDEHSILFKYSKSSMSKLVNNHLIEKSQKNYSSGTITPEYGDTTPEERDMHVATISNHIKKHAMPLPEESHMYSGVKFDMKPLAEKGKVFHTPAFTSTSTTLDTARGFAGTNKSTVARTNDTSKGYHIANEARTYERHIIHFKLPKGYNKGMHMAPVSNYPHEHEYLLDHGQNWKITGHQKVTRTHFSNHKALKPGESNNVERVDKSKEVTHYHIWTVEPHDEHIKEAFDHVDDTKTLTDTKNMSPGQFKFNPKHQEEHEHLSALHTAAAKPYNLSLRRFSMMSNELNTSLINGEKISPIWSGVHEKIQTMFKSTPALTKEHHVYTGLGDFDPSEHLKHSAGVFKTKSYMSTSISPDIAIGHSNIKSFGTDNEHVIHFHLPAGYKGGHYIADHSMVKGEHEMLLNHGQKFKVTAHNKYSIKRPDGSDATRHVWSVTPHE